MTVSTVVGPTMKGLVPAMAPAAGELASALLSARNARIAAQNARSVAAFTLAGQLVTEVAGAAPVVMSEFRQLKAERHRHLEALQASERVREALQIVASMLPAELDVLADAADPAAASMVLSDYRRTMLLLTGVAPASDR